MALNDFIGINQLKAIQQGLRGEERSFFVGKIAEVENTVASMPKTYETDGQGDEAVVYLHYFTPSADFYITERDCEVEQLQAFGLADLGYSAELGYISIKEITECGAELDLHWEPKKLKEVRKEKTVVV